VWVFEARHFAGGRECGRLSERLRLDVVRLSTLFGRALYGVVGGSHESLRILRLVGMV